MKFFRKVLIKDLPVSQFQDNVASILQPLSKNPILDGTLVSTTLVNSGGSATINHKLGRLPLGYIFVDSDAAVGTLYRTSWTSSTITFAGLSGDITATLYVF